MSMHTPSSIAGFKPAKVLKSYGRFRTWGEENRAVLLPSSRGSLDHTLRTKETLRKISVEMLEKLGSELESGGYAIRSADT
jgi:hypothetical protein